MKERFPVDQKWFTCSTCNEKQERKFPRQHKCDRCLIRKDAAAKDQRGEG